VLIAPDTSPWRWCVMPGVRRSRPKRHAPHPMTRQNRYSRVHESENSYREPQGQDLGYGRSLRLLQGNQGLGSLIERKATFSSPRSRANTAAYPDDPKSEVVVDVKQHLNHQEDQAEGNELPVENPSARSAGVTVDSPLAQLLTGPSSHQKQSAAMIPDPTHRTCPPAWVVALPTRRMPDEPILATIAPPKFSQRLPRPSVNPSK
jgi:hypothetical protein